MPPTPLQQLEDLLEKKNREILHLNHEIARLHTKIVLLKKAYWITTVFYASLTFLYVLFTLYR